MSFVRSLPIIIFIFGSVVLWTLGITLVPAEKRGAYAALVCGTDVPDREIRERLEAQGLTGLVSESGQWVLLDSFGSIERISLDDYHARILPFDPRNDGYAEKLRSLFVRDDQRFIYIPLGSPVARTAGIEKKLAAALEDIPYSFYAPVAGRPSGLFLALFCLATIAFFIVRPLRSALRPHAACLIPLLPVIAPLALGGSTGFALASLLTGCAVLLAGPCLEWFTLPRRYGAMPAVCWLLPPLLIICYALLAAFSGLHPVFTLLVFAFFCGVMAFMLRALYHAAIAHDDSIIRSIFFQRRNREHRRFSPVPILRRRSFTFAFSWAMLPFAAVALVLVCVNFAISPSQPSVFPPLPSADAVTEADYYTHYRFQSTFSYRTLHTSLEDGMTQYELAPDGLLGQTGDFSTQDTSVPPPFPLGDLLQYLDTAGQGRGTVYLLLFTLLPLFFIFPLLFYGRMDRKDV